MKRIFEFSSNAVSPPTLSKVLQLLILEFVPDKLPSFNDKLLMIEEAWWYYIDVYRLLYPELPRLEFIDFVKQIAFCVPTQSLLQNELNTTSPDILLSDFNNFKSTIPCYGAILMDEDLQHVLAVQAFRTTRWGFPKGKMKIKEDPVVCAVREVEEEIGFNVLPFLVKENPIEIIMGKKKVTYFFCHHIPLTTPFHPKTRMEIHKIAWLDIDDITREVIAKNPDFNFFNQLMINAMLTFVAHQKGIEPKLLVLDTPCNSSYFSENSFGMEYFSKLYTNAFKTGSLHR
ncbi:hypothetical protein ENUP19_0265G0049 [Entamoeba nuttalli]|uniref:MutT/nudix family protein n=2 Tax=Entamoeba nuttalli TaxID=412467 RepID=K2HPB3_ENTNP|nr:mutT/nudix family protein [Entamoeba nuttalli P19]EKE37690.1 mutT/nudix family protein [Entamoeba nuttalli P19]|eukprot:XP_008859977.1 mutT/nudix family protein [Entamoeba nuttalli P19]